MKVWVKILVPVLAGTAILLLPILLWCRRRRRQLVPRSESPQFTQSTTKGKTQSLQAGIARLQLPYRSNTSRQAGLLLHHHHPHDKGQGEPGWEPTAAPFNWDDHPGLAVEAVENGWSRFMFEAAPSADSLPPRCAPAWGLCAVCDAGSGSGRGRAQRRDSVETNWEVPGAGSSDFLQTVRLKPIAARSSSSPLLVHGESSITTARMLLPLPGPPLGVSSFPREAYFEITILYLKSQQQQPLSSRASRRAKSARAGGESDRAKLIAENSDASAHDMVVPNVIDTSSPNQEPAKEEGGKQNHTALLSLGLTHGGSLPSRSFSGTYPGSIGFHSSGSLHLDGTKLVFESERAEWAEVNRVIGCGFDPSKKKVFFTLDAQLMHVIHCNSDMYKAPLYPILDANADALFLVNLGQSMFKYEPANAHRTPNPCFIRSSSVEAAAAIGYEDSRELFSMGRIDSEWFDAAKKSSSSKKSNANHNEGASEVDADSDLFEISLHV